MAATVRLAAFLIMTSWHSPLPPSLCTLERVREFQSEVTEHTSPHIHFFYFFVDALELNSGALHMLGKASTLYRNYFPALWLYTSKALVLRLSAKSLVHCFTKPSPPGLSGRRFHVLPSLLGCGQRLVSTQTFPPADKVTPTHICNPSQP